MKSKRHAKIIELVNKYEIETQDDLAERLNAAGFTVTQATISRDIRELKLSKVAGHGGRQKYAVIANADNQMTDKYTRVFKDGYVSKAIATNLIVIKTVTGMAMAVATALDHMEVPGLVGCIAGDDTIMCAIHSDEDTYKVMELLDKIVKNEQERR